MTPGLSDEQLPDVFRSADVASLRGQRRYIRSSLLRLSAVVGAAAFAAFSIPVTPNLDLAAVFVAVLFVAALLVEYWQREEEPAAAWYDGRALAESAKTLAWRYAVRAAPFAGDDGAARDMLLQSLRALTEELSQLSVPLVDSSAVTEAMESMRALPLSSRRAAYLEHRLHEQQRWYTGKSRYNKGRASRWRAVLLSLELLGVVAALLKAFGVVAIDLPGIVAAAIGAGAAWLALKQHDANARAYSLAANELKSAREELAEVNDEAIWSIEAADAEEAISREHTMWRASRSSSNLLRALIDEERRSRRPRRPWTDS